VTPLAIAASFAEETFQGYLRGLKFVWKEELYRRVVAAARARRSNDPVALAAAMRGDVDYALYAWLEHRGQQFKYLSRYGMLPIAERQASRLEAALAEAETARPRALRLDPRLELPAFYTRADFHQHPGGIWSDDVDAFMYEWAANAFSFSMAAADKPYAWFAQYMAGRFPARRVADLGCGFGKSTLPIKEARPDSEVTGIDLSKPALRLANRRAFERGIDATFVQARAEATGLPGSSFDAIVSTWLLHELPVDRIRAVLAESFRLLAPGGVAASHDLHTVPGDVVGSFLHLGHAVRNNEPFLPGLVALDLCAEFRRAGFVDVELVDSMTGAPGATSSSPLADERQHKMTVVLGRRAD
jgi:ubiquinone/menaquinone biosynthesis C-methylase UbiE